MKVILLLLFFLGSLFSLTLEESKHLLNRTSFGYTNDELSHFQTLSKEEAVDVLIESTFHEKTLPFPSDIQKVSTKPTNFKSLSKKQKKMLRKQRTKKIRELQIWWLKMMSKPQYAFREKMTLFWHNHFVSEYKSVKNPQFMLTQNMLYRRHALGNFQELLHRSSKDLAMLIYLDSNSNKKSHPNENYARELLELFTMGEGHYNEEDVKEAARAFTGWRVNRKKEHFIKVKKFHDFNEKTFLGKRGNWDGEDIINLVLQQDQTARFITTKLYEEFIDVNINKKLIEKLSYEFKLHDYNLALLMRSLLLSNDFWNSKNRLIKSPIEYTLSVLKASNIALKQKEYHFILKNLDLLGQTLFSPPNVKGWRGHTLWIDTTSLLNRESLIKHIAKKKVPKKQRMVFIKINTNALMHLK